MRPGFVLGLAGGCALFSCISSDPIDIVTRDRRLEAEVASRIDQDQQVPELRNRNIKVVCCGGVVTITANVRNQREKERLLKLADSRGVRQVVDHITVRP